MWTDQLFTALDAPATHARALPPRAFSDWTLFEAERDVFRGDWVFLCMAADVSAPGTWRTVDIAGEPAVLLRDPADATLRLLSNVCRHRGALLLEGAGVLDRSNIVCPYHAWTYSSEGRFKGAPFCKRGRVSPDDHSLSVFRVDTWRGMVFGTLNPDAPALSERVAGVDACVPPPEASWTSVESPAVVWEANWKVILENAMESYHLFKVHPQTLEPYSPTREARYVSGGAHYSVTAGTTYNANGGTGSYTLFLLPPNMVGVHDGQSLSLLVVEPMSPERSCVRAVSAYEGAGSRWTSMLGATAGYEAHAKAFLAEDKAICERVQRGARARHWNGGVLVELERIVGDFHAYLGDRLDRSRLRAVDSVS